MFKNFFKNFFKFESTFERKQREMEAYLSKSISREDLERRERDLARKGYFL